MFCTTGSCFEIWYSTNFSILVTVESASFFKIIYNSIYVEHIDMAVKCYFSVTIFYWCFVPWLLTFLEYCALNCRKKRKWDQPAEVVVSPAMSMPMMQFGGVNPLTTLGMPSMMTMMSNYMGLMAPMNIAAAPLPQPNSAAAIVQKINQVLLFTLFLSF